MTDTFAAVRDAVEHSLVRTVALSVEGKLPRLDRPYYLPSPPPPDITQGKAQMARLAARYPANVRGYDA